MIVGQKRLNATDQKGDHAMNDRIARDLRAELEVIASDELRAELEAWGRWSPEQARRLADYLEEEMQPFGMLSVEKAREAGQALGRERQQARRLLPRLRRAAEVG